MNRSKGSLTDGAKASPASAGAKALARVNRMLADAIERSISRYDCAGMIAAGCCCCLTAVIAGLAIFQASAGGGECPVQPSRKLIKIGYFEKGDSSCSKLHHIIQFPVGLTDDDCYCWDYGGTPNSARSTSCSSQDGGSFYYTQFPGSFRCTGLISTKKSSSVGACTKDQDGFYSRVMDFSCCGEASADAPCCTVNSTGSGSIVTFEDKASLADHDTCSGCTEPCGPFELAE